MTDQPIIVTGCQRSGTTITSHILANAKQYIVLEDSEWLPSPEHVRTLKDLVDSGRTLAENNLFEVEKILDISSYLIVNRNSFKINNNDILKIIKLFDINHLIK